MINDPILNEIHSKDNPTDAIISILNIVRAVKGEIGTEKIVVNVRISPEATTVSLEPWEPYESDTVALLNALVGKVVEIREEVPGND